MKAYEAIQILEVLDPNTEVTLTLPGVRKIKPTNGTPEWNKPFWPQNVQPHWTNREYVWPANTITCKSGLQ